MTDVEAFGSSVWIATHTLPGGSQSQIYIYTSTNSGNTWRSPKSLSGINCVTSFPFTVATSDGKNLFVAWSDQTSTSPLTWILRVFYSSDGGSTWTVPPGINVSRNPAGTNTGDNYDIATGAISAFTTHRYTLWQLVSGSSSQIYFSSS